MRLYPAQMYGFELLSDRKQQWFVACLNACEHEEFCDESYLNTTASSSSSHTCTRSRCEFLETKETSVWVCTATGKLHECGERCGVAEYMPDMCAYVCPLTAMVTKQQPQLSMDAFDKAAESYARPALSVTRKRKAGDEDVGVAERNDEGHRTGNRIYWMNSNVMKISRRLPPIAAANAGEAQIVNACASIMDSLFASETARKTMNRSDCLIADAPAAQQFELVCKYARLVVVHSAPFAAYNKTVQAEPLCLAVLYSWIMRGVDAPPTLSLKPGSIPWISAHVPPQKKIQLFELASNSGCSVAVGDITAMDKLLQEALRFWNSLSQTLTLQSLSRLHWVPQAVASSVQQRLSSHGGGGASAAAASELYELGGVRHPLKLKCARLK